MTIIQGTSTASNSPTVFPNFIEASWERCFNTYNLAPDHKRPIDVLTNAELRQSIDRYNDLVAAARDEVDDLFKRLLHGEYIVSLASPDGAKIIFRCDPYRLGELSSSGVLLGALWSEESQGTNGIGTCLKLGQPLAIVGEQHFQKSLKSFTCIVSPIHNRDGVVEGVLNVSSLQAETLRTASLLVDIVKRSARRIEAKLFIRQNGDLMKMAGDVFNNNISSMIGSNDMEHFLFNRISGQPATRSREDIDMGSYGFGSMLDVAALGSRRVLEQFRTMGRKEFRVSAAMRKTAQRASTTASIAHDEPTPLLDPRHNEVFETAQRLLSGGQPIVLLGESGTGKSRFAQRLARWFGDAGREMLLLSGMTEPAELFNEIEALKLISPHGLVLDYAKNLPLEAQKRLLCWLEDSRSHSSTRVPTICIETDDTVLDEDRGGVMRDLAHRLEGTFLELQPLRNAPNLPEIVQKAFDLECVSLRRSAIEIAPETMAILTSYHWPDNMRGLFNVARHAVILADQTVRATDLPQHLARLSDRDITASSVLEATRIQSALRYHKGKIAETARYLGISRATLYRKIRLHALS